MHLSPRELEKLTLAGAGFLAQKRLARGLKLNYPEAVALIAAQLLEFIRDGHDVASLVHLGREFLGRNNVLAGVPELIEEVQVEGTFRDGSKLVTVHHPIHNEDGNFELALHGSFLPHPDASLFKPKPSNEAKNPNDIGFVVTSHIVAREGMLTLNEGRRTIQLAVTNLCDRPIQIGSHYHFIECNPYLQFDRALSYGMRLNIAAGTAVRFEPGERKAVSLVEIAGNKIISGGNALATGAVKDDRISSIVTDLVTKGFKHLPQEGQISKGEIATMPRDHYAAMYGPTVGDKVYLADTGLVLEVEKDFTVYGDECKFGGGKVLREGMGQATGASASSALDTVITNALVVDYTGIYKADIGIKGGLIHKIGKAGNPDVMAGVDPDMIVGVTTDVIAGEGLILSAGGIDSHIHFICPQQATEAISSGVTTMIGGGTGPSTGTNATTCSPSPFHIKMMLQATDALPLNFGFTGKGNSSSPIGLEDQVKAGAIGLKLHEDWGTTPAAIDSCLSVAENYDVQVTIHTDTLNESACVEHSIAAFKGRSIHTYHSEGAGGGHAPDIIKVCGIQNVLPSSTNPTRPYTVNTLEEHLDMLMVCHHLDKKIKEDVSFAESRIRGETIAAEDILHDLGAIAMMSSDSQAMGRVGEVITRTWQTAAKMKSQRGYLPEDASSDNDNFRIKRYISKYTINPAVTHGVSHIIGSVEKGKLADLVLWKPSLFGVKPEMIIKGGFIAYAQMGDPNASIPTPQPVFMRPMFGSYGSAVGGTSRAFVSQVSLSEKIATNYGLTKKLEAVRHCRRLNKQDMLFNNALPDINVDPETYVVTADSKVITCEPANSLPLTQQFLFA